jgi:hypothetical protein
MSDNRSRSNCRESMQQSGVLKWRDLLFEWRSLLAASALMANPIRPKE